MLGSSLRGVALAVVLLWSSAAAAQSGGTDYGAPGAYLQLGASAAIEDFDLGSGIDADTGYVIDPLIGYRLNRVIAFEFQGRFLDELDLDAFGSTVEVDGWSILFNAKLYAPVPWRIQPFVKFGSGYTEIEVGNRDFDDVGVQVGGGAEYYLDEKVALGIEGTHFIGVDDLEDFDFFTVGAFMKFRY